MQLCEGILPEYYSVSDMYQTSEWSAVPVLILLQTINI